MSSIKGVEDGGILRITGKDRMVRHNSSEIPAIGEYTSVMLYYNDTSALPVHVVGNLRI